LGVAFDGVFGIELFFFSVREWRNDLELLLFPRVDILLALLENLLFREVFF
jgi:hypothetical protein